MFRNAPAIVAEQISCAPSRHAIIGSYEWTNTCL